MRHPIMCWDIVMEGISRRSEFSQDIKAIQQLMNQNNWQSPERELDNCIVWENKTLIFTDPSLNIKLATKNLYEMNGYKPAEVVGKHPKFFQGEATCVESRKIISMAIQQKVPFSCDIVNYRKDGHIYTCHIDGYPIFDKAGKLVNFVAIENAA